MHGVILLLTGLVLAGNLYAEEKQIPVADPRPTKVLDLAQLTGVDALLTKLKDKRVVYVGETHDRYDHHLNQLAIIKGIYRQNPDLVIGMEFFQQPYQRYLDQYVAGEIDDKALVKHTEYFQRWRYDYRLYRIILRFARDNAIPLLALNIPAEITEKIAAEGIDSLSAEARQMVPAEIDKSNTIYRERLEKIFSHHPNSEQKNFEHFFEAQLVWDESMAAKAANYLTENPARRMVILVGAGHLEYGYGIPSRLQRRLPVDAAVVINGTHYGIDPAVADYLLISERQDLPGAGLLGVYLDTGKKGVKVKGFSKESLAEKAGIKKGDQITRIEGEPVHTYSDIRISLLDRRPGEAVKVEVVRENLLLGDEQKTIVVTLH